MARQALASPLLPEPKVFLSVNEIDRGIAKLQRRLDELNALDLRACVYEHTRADDAFFAELRSTVSEVFGPNSPELKDTSEQFYYTIVLGMEEYERVQLREEARSGHRTHIQSLIKRLKEKREDLEEGDSPAPSSYFDKLKLHPRIADVARDMFLDGHHWPAVFEASKALFNYVKERSRMHHLDGVPLMTTVFSRKNPVLAFNELADKTQEDEQEGMMHLFMGAALAIRNPGGHSFPEGSEQRAIEYISLLSTLAYRVHEARIVRPTA